VSRAGISALVGMALFVRAPTFAVPAPPILNPALVAGSTVTLSWSVPFGTTGIRLEAGTAPGLSNAVSTVIGPIGSYTATNVPPGTYYARVRAIDATGESAPSNEVIVAVGGSSACVMAPGAPQLALPIVAGNTVILTWTPAATGCTPTGYILLAGSAPGLSNLAVVPTPGLSLFASAPNGTYYVRVVAQNAAGVSGPSNERVFSIGATAPGPSPVPSSFGPGQWRVWSQITPGRYFADPARGCYWERQEGLSGSINDVIANEFVGFDALQWVVDILATDLAFETDPDCGSWSRSARPAPNGIPGGVWLVGSQVPPGTYGVNASRGCYWARLRDFTGNLSGIIDNEFVSGGGPQLVTITASDVGFENDGDCGTWTRVSASAPPRQSPSPDDIVLQWLSYYQHRSGAEPKPLLKQ
jgi:hypothetical protein